MVDTRHKPTLLRHAVLLVAAVALLLMSGCSGGPGTEGSASSGSGVMYPDVEDVAISGEDDGTYTLEVTMTSPYDTPDRYADGWRVLAPDGTELASMTLTHDHAGEQPFTRTQVGVQIPSDVSEVTVEGHDQQSGYGGQTQTVTVPR